MQKLLIGSQALKNFVKLGRNPKDWDYVVKQHNYNKIKSDKQIEYFCSPTFDQIMDFYNYASLDLLYTIKMSHSFWSINWIKTVKDILLMKAHGS